MRVLILSTTGVRKDGITSWIVQVFGRMEMLGIEDVHTIAYEGVEESLVRQLADVGLRTHVLPNRKTQPLAYLRSLRRLIKANRYDIVHVNGNSGTAAIELFCCIGAGVSARLVHSHNTQGMYPTYDRLLRPAMNALCTDRVACGRDAGEWLFAKQKYTIIRNGRDFEEYSFKPEARARVRHELGLSDEEIAVGHVGYFHEPKNHKFLIEAFAIASRENANLRLFLVGEGEMRSEVENQVNHLELTPKVTFLGRSSRVPDYLNAFDLAVLPSLYEGLPTVAIEWQISGLPVLISSAVTDECGLTDLVQFVPIAEASVWARHIARAAPVDRVASSAAAQRLLRDAGYDANEGAARLRGLYVAISRREGLS